MSLSEINKPCTPCEVDENLKILRDVYFFSALPIEMLKLFGYLCARENFIAGDYLFQQGDDDGQAFYILEGRSRLVRRIGDQERVLREYREGDFLGGLALVGNVNRLFSLRAETPMTCIILTREKFSKAMERFPDLMPKILKAVAARLNDWEERYLNESARTSRDCDLLMGISLI